MVREVYGMVKEMTDVNWISQFKVKQIPYSKSIQSRSMSGDAPVIGDFTGTHNT